MGRWTTNSSELDHLTKITSQVDATHGTVGLKDGQKVYGILLPARVAHNESGQSQADIIVRVKKETGYFEDHKVDVLDVAEIMPGRLN
jgi:hypothetical protein